jgi:NTE family protein
VAVTERAPGPSPTAGASPRIALVLGAGGMAGIAFHAGVLAALEEGLGWDPRQAELVVGTSAGSITASGLRAGLAASDLLARVAGGPLSPEGRRLLAPVDEAMAAAAVGAHSASGLGRLRPASPGLLWAVGRRPWAMRPGALLAGLLPAGRNSTGVISAGVDALGGGAWPELPTWICAVALDSGRLTVFGRHGSPPAGLGQAVAASCAIPGYFAPVPIGGRRYVDGGAHSTTNLAEVAAEPVDLVVVSAPMARAGSPMAPDPPGWHALTALGRELNRFQLATEARRVRGRGIAVVAFSPTLADRAVMGLNPLDPTRRGPIARQARQSVLSRLARPEVRDRLSLLVA